MTDNTDVEREELLAKAQEIKTWASDMQAKFDAKKAEIEKAKRRNRFFSSRDRKDMWQMPLWLWLPIVIALFSMLVFAFWTISRGA